MLSGLHLTLLRVGSRYFFFTFYKVVINQTAVLDLRNICNVQFYILPTFIFGKSLYGCLFSLFYLRGAKIDLRIAFHEMPGRLRNEYVHRTYLQLCAAEKGICD